MTSPCSRSDDALRRHDLIFVSPAAWRALLESHPGLAQEPLVAGWADRGWPLIVRRIVPGEAKGLPLGLPLPPSDGKRRLAFVVQSGDVIATAPPPLLRDAVDAAPPAWRPTMERLVDLAAAYDGEARVFGSLAWRLLTGLDYLTAHSDLDMLLPLPPAGDVTRLTGELAALESAAPMHLDGELVRSDGAAVNWRELHEGAQEVLVKTIRDATLAGTGQFLGAEAPS
jgi:phosphoribosyl-dephospho-CoA transferase